MKTEDVSSIEQGLARVAVVGTSFRRVGLGRLGAFVLPQDAVAEQAALRAALGADELVYVATCNRVECHLLLARPCADDELLARATAFFGARADDMFVRQGGAAAEHLLSVASGLDSLVLGETEISGQLKRAHERARAAGLSGPTLERLFERAAACSRRVKNEVGLGRAPDSAASIAVQKVRKHFGAEGPRVTVFVGAGEMTRKVAQALARTSGERIFVNRTRARAEELAARFGGRALSLDELRAAPPPRVDLLFSATAAGETVVPAAVLAPALAARSPADPPIIVCDLGVPRDVDPAVDALSGVRVVDMRTIQAAAQHTEERLAAEVARARGVVRAEVALAAREERFRALALESARALVADRLAHLSPDDQDAVVRYAAGLASRMARQPLAAGAR